MWKNSLWSVDPWASSGIPCLHYKCLLLVYSLLSWHSRRATKNGLLLYQVNLAYVEAKEYVSEPVNREPPSREAQILTLRNMSEFDILVIGGGATGCGCALDAVTRGKSRCGCCGTYRAPTFPPPGKHTVRILC